VVDGIESPSDLVQACHQLAAVGLLIGPGTDEPLGGGGRQDGDEPDPDEHHDDGDGATAVGGRVVVAVAHRGDRR